MSGYAYILTVENLTSSYHAGGGLVVVARDLEHAKLLVAATSDPLSWKGQRLQMPTDAEWEAATAFPLDPAFEPKEGDPTVHVFPDAGCC